jgi:hypothetical protein
MLFENNLVHPTVMMRASAIREHGLWYDASAVHIDDYDLWSRALPLVRFANIPEPLLQYRLHGANTGDLHGERQREGRASIYRRFFSQLGVEYSQSDLALQERIGLHDYGGDAAFLQHTCAWLEKLSRANRQTHLIDLEIMDLELGTRWTQACQYSEAPPLALCSNILSSPLRFCNKAGIPKLWQVFKFSIARMAAAKTR